MGFQTKAAFSDLKKSYRRIVRGISRAQAAYSFFWGAVLPPFLSMRDAPQAVSIVDEEAENSSANCQKDF